MTAPPVVPLATDVDRVPAHTPPLSAAQRDRSARLARDAVSLHDHPVRLPDPLTPESWAALADSGRQYVGDAGLARSGLAAVFASKLAGGTLDEALAYADALTASLATARHAYRAVAWSEVRETGTAVFAALEDLGPVGTDLSGLDTLYAKGFRSAGLAYNAGSALAGGLGEATDGGLTALGRDAVRRMAELGMVVDVAHVGDVSTVDTARYATGPVVISHAGARAVWPTPRMKPDDVLRAVADTDGLIGIEAAPGSTRSRRDGGGHTLDDAMHHLEYCAALVGVQHVALGPDTFFGDHLGLYDAAGWPRPAVPGLPDLDAEYVAGMENPGEAVGNTAAWLVAHGWSDTDITAALGGNARRVLGAVL
ncbi:dipeptidase [Actinocatenispora rupis]|uniref:Peptidase n=1 Tax=Actinocatenispora rupis TaxID=519421 RepID=A0A8J3NCU7_9ACTN|nr:membrane dipeptidase [Actinocatenispora rupis]GID14689.1 peptidase [Actinocatenispora rupis]